MTITNKTIFITGGAGNIGSTLATNLCESYRVVLFDNLSRNTIGHTGLADHPNVRLVTGDILDYDTLLRARCGADIVIRATAIAGIDTVIKSPITRWKST